MGVRFHKAVRKRSAFIPTFFVLLSFIHCNFVFLRSYKFIPICTIFCILLYI